MFKLMLLINAYFVLSLLLIRLRRTEGEAGTVLVILGWLALYLWAPSLLLYSTLVAGAAILLSAKRPSRPAGAPAMAVTAQSVCGYDVTGYVVPSVHARKTAHRHASFMLPPDWNATTC